VSEWIFVVIVPVGQWLTVLGTWGILSLRSGGTGAAETPETRQV